MSQLSPNCSTNVSHTVENISWSQEHEKGTIINKIGKNQEGQGLGSLYNVTQNVPYERERSSVSSTHSNHANHINNFPCTSSSDSNEPREYIILNAPILDSKLNHADDFRKLKMRQKIFVYQKPDEKYASVFELTADIANAMGATGVGNLPLLNRDVVEGVAGFQDRYLGPFKIGQGRQSVVPEMRNMTLAIDGRRALQQSQSLPTKCHWAGDRKPNQLLNDNDEDQKSEVQSEIEFYDHENTSSARSSRCSNGEFENGEGHNHSHIARVPQKVSQRRVSLPPIVMTNQLSLHNSGQDKICHTCSQTLPMTLPNIGVGVSADLDYSILVPAQKKEYKQPLLFKDDQTNRILVNKEISITENFENIKISGPVGEHHHGNTATGIGRKIAIQGRNFEFLGDENHSYDDYNGANMARQYIDTAALNNEYTPFRCFWVGLKFFQKFFLTQKIIFSKQPSLPIPHATTHISKKSVQAQINPDVRKTNSDFMDNLANGQEQQSRN